MRDFLDWFRTADPETRKKGIGLIAMGVLMTLLGGGSIAYILKARTVPKAAEEKIADDHGEKDPTLVHSSSSYSFPYEINQISMAMMNRKGTQTAYAQFSLILDCPSEESKKTLTMNRAKLLDSVFVVGSSFFLDDFKGPEALKGFEKFKTQLLEKYQSDFQAQAPREISLKDWIVN